MKASRMIIPVISVLATLFFFSYARIQTKYAIAAIEEAEILKAKALTLEQEARAQRNTAVQSAADARRAMNQVETLEKLLQECRK